MTLLFLIGALVFSLRAKFWAGAGIAVVLMYNLLGEIAFLARGSEWPGTGQLMAASPAAALAIDVALPWVAYALARNRPELSEAAGLLLLTSILYIVFGAAGALFLVLGPSVALAILLLLSIAAAGVSHKLGWDKPAALVSEG